MTISSIQWEATERFKQKGVLMWLRLLFRGQHGKQEGEWEGYFITPYGRRCWLELRRWPWGEWKVDGCMILKRDFMDGDTLISENGAVGGGRVSVLNFILKLIRNHLNSRKGSWQKWCNGKLYSILRSI